MICLEVAVNGDRYCLAGAEDVSFVYAGVELFRSGIELTVCGLRADPGAMKFRYTRE